MSASKLFPYKMKKKTWYRAEDVTESDIAVIVDTNRDTIFYWEGGKSSARNRSDARDILGQLKKKYIPYRFKRVNNNSPSEVLDKLEELKEKSFTGKIEGIEKYELKDFSKMFYLLNIIGSLLVVICLIFLWQALFWEETNKGVDHTHYSVGFGVFTFYIEMMSLLLLLALVIFSISTFSGVVVKKKLFSAISLISVCSIFIAFFIIRIWDNLIYYKIKSGDILIRKDVMLMFILSIEALLIPALALGLFSGLVGLKNIQLFEDLEELEEKPEVK